MPKVLIVDDHMAVRAGLRSVLRLTPAIEVVGAVGDVGTALAKLRERHVDVALLDYRLPDGDGLGLCRQIRAEWPDMGVLLYSALPERALAPAAVVAGADGLVGKGTPAEEVIRAIEAVGNGGTAHPPIPPAALRDAATKLRPESLPILGMRIEGTPEDEIALTLGIEREQLRREVDAIVLLLAPQRAWTVAPTTSEDEGARWTKMHASPHDPSGIGRARSNR